jgi:hypothetical protein
MTSLPARGDEQTNNLAPKHALNHCVDRGTRKLFHDGAGRVVDLVVG